MSRLRLGAKSPAETSAVLRTGPASIISLATERLPYEVYTADRLENALEMQSRGHTPLNCHVKAHQHLADSSQQPFSWRIKGQACSSKRPR